MSALSTTMVAVLTSKLCAAACLLISNSKFIAIYLKANIHFSPTVLLAYHRQVSVGLVVLTCTGLHWSDNKDLIPEELALQICLYVALALEVLMNRRYGWVAAACCRLPDGEVVETPIAEMTIGNLLVGPRDEDPSDRLCRFDPQGRR